MNDKFSQTFSADRGALGPFADWSERDTRELVQSELPAFTRFMHSFARTSFNDGVIRFLKPDALRTWNSAAGWHESWPQWRGRFVVFAMDWQGRQIGFDLRRHRDGEPLVSLLDIGSAEFFETEARFQEFVENELVEYPNETISLSRYKEWRNTGGAAPGEQQSIGYREPLFLGGSDDFSNVEVTDTDVYVSICGQIYDKIKDLPDGAPVRGFTIG